MQGVLRSLLGGLIRLFVKPVLSAWVPVGIQRAWTRAVMASSLPPRAARAETISMNGVPAERVTVPVSGQRVLMYLHGGGYCVGASRPYRPLAAQLARATEAAAYVPDYRLAPEHPHPAALEDALSAYRWLLGRGVNPAMVCLGGDSAGGGLALATAVAIRADGLPLPAALALISPWVDLSLSGESMATLARRDPMLSASILGSWARAYRGAVAAGHPACSPLFADLEGLPPMLIQVGTEEVLLSDAERLEEKARSAGVTVRLTHYERMWHDFPMHAGVLRESDRAISEIGEFVKNTIATN